MCEAWESLFRTQLTREANWVACLMNATGNFKEPITPDSLIKEGKTQQKLDMEKIRQRAEERRLERLQLREQKQSQP